MKEVIRILIVDYKSPTDKRRHISDLIAFCKAAHIQQPSLLPLKGQDCYEIELTDLPERTALLYLHILCDFAALNPNFVVELQQRESFEFLP